MKKSKFTGKQNAFALRKAEVGHLHQPVLQGRRRLGEQVTSRIRLVAIATYD